MNKRLYIIRRKTTRILAILFLLPVLSACDSFIYDDTSECYSGFRIHFKYDYNMKFADAFPKEVDKVNLFVFDEQGRFVTFNTESGDALKDPNYTMTLDIAPGTYHLVAWPGLDGTSYSFTENIESIQTISDLKIKLNQPENRISNQDLRPLWYGEITEAKIGNQYEDVTISLHKFTKRIRLVMQQMDGVPITENDFRFEITDDNSLVNYDNSIIPNSTTTYQPYVSGHGTIGDIDTISHVFAEFHVGRLMKDSGARLRVISNSTDQVIVDIPLIEYLLLTELEGHKESMSTQEYLDRQDEYSLVFFLGKDLSWLKIQIIVNGWTIRFNNQGL